MRALSHYWRVTRQDVLVAQALLEKAICHRSELRPGARPCLLPARRSAPTWAGRIWRRRRRWPSARRWPRSWPTARTPGRITRWGRVYLFERRFDNSLAELELALRLNPNFSLAQGYYGLALSYCRALGRRQRGRAARVAAEPARSVFGGLLRHRRLRPVRRAQLRRGDSLAREGIRQRSDFVGAHRVLTAARRHGWKGRCRRGRPCRSFAARNPIFRSPGSQTKCRSSMRPIGSTIWRVFAAPGWISRGVGRRRPPLIQASLLPRLQLARQRKQLRRARP